MDEETNQKSLDYSFACGGWLKLYLFGVAKFLQENEQLIEKSRFIGCSAGALTATGLAVGADFDKIKNFVFEDLIPRTHGTLLGAFKVRSYVAETLEKHGKLQSFEKVNADQNLVISYSSLTTCKAKRVSTFKSSQEMQSALLASCCATPIAGFPFQIDNEWVYDGGLTDFQPVFDEQTIKVNPFYCANADIMPSRYVPIWWAFYPPNIENLNWLYQLGYEDAHAWAFSKNLVKFPLAQENAKAATIKVQTMTKLGRFLGYRALESRIFDAVFIICITLLWKPLAFFLVYVELILRALYSGSKAAIFGAACKLMISLAVAGGFASLLPLVFTFSNVVIPLAIIGVLSIVFVMVVLYEGGLERTGNIAYKNWNNCRTCLRNIASLSLFLRTLPGLGAAVPIKRHEYLLKHSFVYRLTNHFV